MSDSTAIGIARVAAAMTEMMRAHASPADQAIQRGIDDCMRGVIRAQTSMDPGARKCPTDQPAPPQLGQRPAPEPDYGGPFCVVPSKRRGWQPDHPIRPPIEPDSVVERVVNGMIDQACGPLVVPKAAKPKADDQT